MKFIYTIPLIAIIALAITSCSKTNNTPPPTTRVDTSKNLVADKRLVGNWDIVTDTVSYNGNNVLYHGSAGDYYKFTNYGNLYIAESLGNLVDTAIYTIASTTNQVGWVNLYTSINGQSTTVQSLSPPFTITHVDSTKLILTQNASTAAGVRYEQITFKKKK
jgi:hypothetical protein